MSKQTIILSYAIVSEHSFNQTMYELEKTYPGILKMRSKNPLSFIIRNNRNNEYIIYLKVVPNIPITKSILEINELRGYDFRHRHIVRSIQELINNIRYEIGEKENMSKQNKFYYEIINSWWEVFSNEKIRVRRKVSAFKYKTYEDAHKVTIKLRKRDHYYRYNLGDRIYVKRRRCYE